MNTLTIKNATVVGLEEFAENQAVTCRDGIIETVAPMSVVATDPEGDIVDAKGQSLAPGFIDLHTHGAHEHTFDNGPADLLALRRRIPEHGVTGFLPTLCLHPGEDGLRFLGELASSTREGTQVLGFHLEGPFISLPGAIPPDRLGFGDAEWIRAAIQAAHPFPLVFSVSPEYPRISKLAGVMIESGARIFMTHTRATAKQTEELILAGARHATHFYNVFPQPPAPEGGVRAAGAVEAILAAPEVSVDFILDGEHVDPMAIKMALACKSPGHVCLVTDSMTGAGSGPGRFETMAGEVIEMAYEGAPARFASDSRLPGALYGSGLTLDVALRNAVQKLDLDLPQAIRLVSTNPAKVIGLEQSKGQIREGFDADLVLLDQDLRVRQTWIKGLCCPRETS